MVKNKIEIIKGGETERQTETENLKNLDRWWERIGEARPLDSCAKHCLEISLSVYQSVSQVVSLSVWQLKFGFCSRRHSLCRRRRATTSCALHVLGEALKSTWVASNVHSRHSQLRVVGRVPRSIYTYNKQFFCCCCCVVHSVLISA